MEATSPYNVEVFFPETKSPTLSVIVWYVASDGRNRWTNLNMRNRAASSAEEFLQDIGPLLTPFVRRRWFRIEACTPQRMEFGALTGGHGRVLLTRTIEI